MRILYAHRSTIDGMWRPDLIDGEKFLDTHLIKGTNLDVGHFIAAGLAKRAPRRSESSAPLCERHGSRISDE